EWNDTGSDGVWEGPVSVLVERRAAERPADPAVVDAAGPGLAHGELGGRAGGRAAVLLAVGGGGGGARRGLARRGVRLPIRVPGGARGAPRPGAAYPPLDPSYRADRLALRLAEPSPPLVRPRGALLGGMPATPSRIVCLARARGEIERHPAVPAAPVEPEQVA